METLDIIRESFETWYNKVFKKENRVSVAINYSDTRSLAVKAYHKIQLEVRIIGIENDKAFCTPIILMQENYNHGTTTEQEAKDAITQKLLMNLYSYRA